MGLRNLLSKTKVFDIRSSLPDGVVILSQDGSIQWLNDVAQKSFFNNEKVLNEPIDDYYENASVLVKQADASTPCIIKSTSSDKYIEVTTKHVDKVCIVAMRDATQKYKTVNDILEGHKNSQKCNNDKNAFLIKISNDLKAPLHSVIGFSQAIIDGLGGDISEKQEKYLRIINKHSSDLLHYFNQLLFLSETEMRAFSTDVKFFDIENAVLTTVKTCEQLYPDKQLDISTVVDEDLRKTIYSDEKAFKLMFQTLFETIMRSADIGAINVSMKNADEELLAAHNLSDYKGIHIQVTNNSNGILESEIPTLFNPYSVVDNGNKRTIVRSISLASVKNIMNYLHGLIWAETEPLKGTVFNIVIPFDGDKHE